MTRASRLIQSAASKYHDGCTCNKSDADCAVWPGHACALLSVVQVLIVFRV